MEIPIAGANVLQFGETGGANFSVYDWNTGYANPGLEANQEMAFSIVESSLFFGGAATATPQPVFGFRIDNDGEADVKFFGASEDTFLNNPLNPNIPGAAAIPGSISGTVTEDTNNDGAGEVPIAGVTVQLFADTNGDGQPDGAAIATTTTGTDGSYRFDDLQPGNYVVVETQPNNFTDVTDGDSTEPGDDVANGSTLDNIIPVGVVSEEEDTGNDFVEVAVPGAISGTITEDTNGDGSGDDPIAGVTVQLFADTNGNGLPDGNAIATTTTGINGSYSFSNVAPGDYVVVESQPANFDTVTDGDTTDAGDDIANGSTTDNLIPVSVNPAETDTGNDFVEEQFGSLSGTVLADTNNDGVGEDPIANVTLTLLDAAGNDVDSDPNTSGVQPTTTTTDSNGNYSFTGLAPGDYQVVETQPAGFDSVSDVDGANNNIIGDETPITVVGGENTPGNDFVEEQPGSLSGTVLEDTNNDGVGEEPIAKVTLTLLDAAGNDVDSDPNTSGVQPTTTLTDSNGNYSFTGLEPGDYQVVETQPAGFNSVSDVDGANNNIIGDQIPITVVANENTPGNDFVEEQPGSLSGTVLADTNNDGVGEDPIANVVLTLLDAAGNDVDSDPNTPGVQPTTTTTDSNGNYSFTGVEPGDYQVAETQPAGFDSVSDVDGANNNIIGDETPITVVGGENTPGNDFVEEQPGSLSGTVLADTNNDGVGEDPIANVTLTLLDAAGNDVDSDPNTSGVQPTTTTTDSNGNYSFTGLEPGDYQVVETQPAGFNSVSDVDGANNNIVGDETPITVVAGENTPGNDFVEEQFGSLSGTVLADTNNDGVGEDPIANVTLTLLDAAGNDVDSDPNTPGVQPTTTTTDSNGNYSFTGVEPGDYRVVETQPAGFDSVSDVDGANNNIVGDETPITVVAGENTPGNDFVEEQPGSLSGTVLADTNNDGVGEDPIANVTLTLLDAAGNDVDSDPNTLGIQPTTTTTDSNGNYSFTGLEPGNYQVVETQPAGFNSVSDVDGANNNIIGDETPITVVAGESTPGNDFVEEQPGAISGTVLADTNNDSVGEDPIANVTLTLLDAAGNDVDSDPNTPGVQPTTTTTDSNGNYSFTGVEPGDYQVAETQPAGFDSVSDVDGANNNIIGDETPITVIAGETTPGNDFVEEQPGAISGTVLADTNNDGVGEDPIANVTLTLLDAAGNDVDSDPNTPGVQPTTTTTDSNGNYSFAGVEPGDYQVVETQPAGFNSVSDVDGANNNIIGDETPITVVAGESTPGNDFVEEQPGSLSGTVLADINNDGVGEDPIANVILTLLDAAGNDVDSDPSTPGVQPTTTTTDSDGNYSFTGLEPGEYQVVETQPAGFDSVSDVDGSNNNIIGDETPIAVVAGEDTPGNDFVEEEPGSISGTVLADTNNDGVGEDPIADVTLTLLDAAGNDVDSDPKTPGVQPTTTTTDSDGNYSFTGVEPGDYQVVETQPAGFNSVSDVDGTNNNIIGDETPITVVAGENTPGNDFVEEQPGAISGTVLADTNNDDFGDDPIANVTLTLLDAAGNDVDSDPNTPGVQPTTTTTDSDGNYTFTGVEPGDYQILETQPDGFDSVGDVDGGNSDIIGDEAPITVVAGATTPGNDFVEEQFAVISGEVTQDTVGDGIGNIPVVGAIVELFTDPNGDGDPSDGVQVDLIETNSDGEYLFERVSPGDYVVVETQPDGLLTVIDSDESPDADVANASLTDNLIPVTVTGGETDADNNFVEAEPSSISGTVLQDTNNDGVGDVGIPDVTLTLVSDTGEPIDADGDPSNGIQPITTTTDADGNYSFPSVLFGDYGVLETQPTGFGTVGDEDSTDGDDDLTNGDPLDNLIPVSLSPGEADTGNDFIEFAEKANTYSDFQAEFASDLGDENGPTDNPDGDIYNNILEYALCLHPANGVPSHGGFCLSKDLATGVVSAEFMRRLGGLSDITYTVQVADTLGTPTVWTDLTSVTPVVNTTDADVPAEAEKVVFNNLESATELSDGETSGVARLCVNFEGVNYYTPVFAWQCTPYRDYECASFSVPFSEKPVFSGTFADAGPLTLDTDGDGNVTFDVSASAFGEDLSSLVGSNGEYYLQITSGLFEGNRFDILGGGVNTVTLTNDDDIFEETVATFNTLDGLPTDEALLGASYQIIRYRTIDDLYDRDTLFAGEEDNNPADTTRILLYDSRRANPGFDSVMLVGTAPNTKWVRVTDRRQADQGGRRLDPAIGSFVHPKSSGNPLSPTVEPPVTMFTSGMVASHDQAVVMNEGFNLLGAMYPLDQTPAGPNSRDLTLAQGFDGGTSAASSTELLFWHGDEVVDDDSVTVYTTGYEAFLLADAGATFNYWLNRSDPGTNLDEVLTLLSHRAVMHKILADDEKRPHIYPLPNF